MSRLSIAITEPICSGGFELMDKVARTQHPPLFAAEGNQNDVARQRASIRREQATDFQQPRHARGVVIGAQVRDTAVGGAASPGRRAQMVIVRANHDHAGLGGLRPRESWREFSPRR